MTEKWVPDDPLPVLVMQLVGSAGATLTSIVLFGWWWFAVPMGAFAGWSAWLLARRLGDR